MAVVAAAIIIPQLAGHPPAPSISFTWTARGRAYTFDATLFRLGAPVNYTWTFGDGQSTSGRSGPETNPTQFNVTHTYYAVGTYSVTLSVADPYGNTGSLTQSVVVTNYVPVSAIISATASASTVTATVTVSGGSPPYYVSFNFGDGSATSTQKGNGPQISFTHVYLYTGTYSVKALVGDSTTNGAVSTNTVQVVVTYTSMQAQLATSVSGMNVTAVVSVTGGNSPYTLVYNFGDGSTTIRSGATSVSHRYNQPGTYTVNVTVYDMSIRAPKYLTSTVTILDPAFQTAGVVLAGAGAAIGLSMVAVRKFRRLWLAILAVALLAGGIVLAAGVI